MWFRTETLNLVNLSSADQTAAVRFSKAVEDSKHLTILVHPFFQENNKKQQTRLGMIEYRQARDHFLETWRTENSSLLILEGINTFEELFPKLKRLGLKGDIYTFMTLPHEPTPLSPNSFKDSYSAFLYRTRTHRLPPDLKNQCWNELSNLLSRSQIPFIQLGGEYLVFWDEKECLNPDIGYLVKDYFDRLTRPESGQLFDQHGNRLRLFPRYCVGATATELLKRGFNISLSIPSWPDKMCSEVSSYFT